MWLPNSPDFNPVDDYAIWGALQQMVYYRQSFASVDELKRAIVEAYGRNYCNRSSTRASVNGDRRLDVDCVTCNRMAEVIEHVFN